MKVSIFCSANSNIDPDFFAETEKLGEWLAGNGHEVVFGGCNLGLMECVARAVHNCGGRTIGIIPRIIEENGKRSQYVDEAVFCDSLSQRKDLLLERGDAIIALPGGIGTLDEVFTVAAAYTIGYHRKPVIIYNMKGFWDVLIALLDDLAAKGVIRGNWRDYIRIANTLDEITRLLTRS